MGFVKIDQLYGFVRRADVPEARFIVVGVHSLRERQATVRFFS